MRFILRQLRRFAIGVLLVAGIFVLSIPVTLVSMLARYRAMLRRGVPAGPSGMIEPEGKPSMKVVLEKLKEVPFGPVEPQSLGLAKGALNNSFLGLLDVFKATSGRLYPYPGEFEQVTFNSFDGAPLSAVVGVHPDGKARPGLVVSHGYMGSKNDHYIISTALDAYAGWGFNVLAVDLRDFGGSRRLAFNPTSFGWKEGEDLLAAAKHLGEIPGVTTVGITGFSLGAVSTMRAAYMAREYPYLTGGAIAWNGASDSRLLTSHLDRRPGLSDDFFPFYLGFRMTHWLHREDMKRYVDDPGVRRFLEEPFSDYTFRSFLERISAPHYGVTVDELIRNGSSKEYLADVEVPLLVMHSVDDPIIPVSEMDDLIEIAEQNPDLAVWMMPAGMHCVYPYLDRHWFDTVMRGFFEYWASWEES